MNCNNDDITEKCIEYFAKSTKYFTNGGFAKLLIQKKYENNDKVELCLHAYESDLNNEEFKTPLIYIDEKRNKYDLITLPFGKSAQNEDTKKQKDIIKEVDIVYLIDATGSMGYEIIAAKTFVNVIFDDLKKKYPDYNFKFGAIFYRDKIDSPTDKNEYFLLTDNMEDLKNRILTIKPYGGGGGISEDWVEGYKIALNNIEWRNGIKLIIHITDAGAHGKVFSVEDKYPEEGPKLSYLIEECVKKNINIIGFKIGEEPGQSFEKIKEIYNQYKQLVEDKGQFIQIYEYKRFSYREEKEFCNLVMKAFNENVNSTYKYLKRLKQKLNLPNDIEKDKEDKKSLLSILDFRSVNYVIDEEIYKKMLLLIYRIKADIPVIIMGETDCGKTALITKLNQIINNGEIYVDIINIHPGISDKMILERMKKINEKAKKQEYIDEKSKIKKEYWVLFDEINTCLSSLLTEIFNNKTFNGEKLEDNIRLIGTCNPYRYNIYQKFASIMCGLTRKEDKEDELVYKVHQLPLSLLYYVFSFGSLNNEFEKKYISIIINKLFNCNEKELHKLTTDAISESLIFLRKNFDDPSIVSLRELSQFTKCVKFFQDYFIYKNNQNKNSIDDDTKKIYKIKSIICSIYLCYYIRLINDEERKKFDNKLRKVLLELVNVYFEEKNDENNENMKNSDLFDKIKYKPLKKYIKEKEIKYFSDFLKIEEDFLLNQIDLDKGIGKNSILKENIFLLFIAVVTKIPLIIVGKPDIGKRLSVELIYNSMRGKNSKKNFFKNYPKINLIYFQGSESTKPYDVEKLFRQAENLYENYKKNNNFNKEELKPIFMILFDKLGLAQKSSTNPLKVLHCKLEYAGKSEGESFVGISNNFLDPSKIKRAFNLYVPNLESNIDRIKETAKSIVESISEDLTKDNNMAIFSILSRAYFLYKNYIIFIKKS